MESHFRPRFGTVLGALLLVLVFSIAALAQGTGELTGVVNDPTGAVVPNVEVKLTNTSTGTVRTTVTSAAGVYRFPALPVVGAYDLTIEAKGFKGVAVKAIVVSVGTTINKDVRLEVGGSSEVVNVEGGVQMVQTTESQVSALVDQRVWQQMPLETRNQNEFINLIAGVTPDMFGGSTRGSSVNGTRGGSGNFLVEGADNNDQGQGGRGQISDSQGGAITGISPEAIQEYRVITNSFAAEYGKAGGFVTDTVLKSGTNQWHGSIFEYNRNQALAANGFFSNRETDPETGKTLKDFVVRNQFGGSIGGPIVKDKTFFYTSTEFHRRRDRYPNKTTSVAPEFLSWVQSGGFQNWLETSPDGLCNNQWWLDNMWFGTDDAGNSLVAAAPCAGKLSSAGALGSVFQKLKAKGPFPLATSNFSNDAQGWWTSGLTYPVPVYGDVVVRDGYQLNEYKWSFKFDHKLSNNDQLSASYLLDNGTQTWLYGAGDYSIGPPSVSPGRSQNLGLSWNHTFSPTVLNTFKASYLRHVANYPSYPGYESMPQVYTAADPLGVGFGMSSAMPQFFTDNQFQFQDHLSFVTGKHSFKTGWEYRRTRNGSSFQANKNGEFLPFDVENLVTDMGLGTDLDAQLTAMAALNSAADCEETDTCVYNSNYGGWYWAKASLNPQTGTRPDYYRGFRANEFAMYFQDDFRVNNRLSLNYGVRWEYFGPPHNYKPGIDSNFYFGTPIMPASAVSSNIFFPKNSAFYASVATGMFQQRDHEIWNKDTNNFGPRFGFAYDVFGTQKFVLRGGAGIMYDRIWNNLFENIRFNAPFYSDATIGYAGNGVPSGPLTATGLYTDNFTETNTAGFNNPSYLAKPAPRHMDQNLVSPYYQQYHFGFQYEFMKGYVLETEYVGTMGHKLTAMVDINTFDGRTAAGQSTKRINSSIAGDNFRTNMMNSNYHGLQTTVKKSFSNGLQFNANYTWSKVLDFMSDAFNNRGGARPTDNMDKSVDYGPADFNIKHRFVASFSYDVPFMKGNAWIGGWSLNGILSLQTGVPFSPYNSGFDANRDGYLTDRVRFIGDGSPNGSTKIEKTIEDSNNVGFFAKTDWANANCAGINNGLWCNGGLGRNNMQGPGYFNTDLGVSKKFKVNERAAFVFQGNFFNLFNHANFNLPVANRNDGSFGQIRSTVGNARLTQLALRFEF